MIWPFSQEWRLKRKREKAYKAAQREKENACKAAEQEHEKLQELFKTHSDADTAVFNQQMAYLEAQRKCAAATLALTKLQGAKMDEFVISTLGTLQKQTDDLKKKMDDLRKRKP